MESAQDLKYYHRMITEVSNSVESFDLHLAADGLVAARVCRQYSQPHFHASWTLGHLLAGHLSFCAGNTQYEVTEGEAFLIPPYLVHWGGGANALIEYDVFYVSEALVHDMLGQSFKDRLNDLKRAFVWRSRGEGLSADLLVKFSVPEVIFGEARAALSSAVSVPDPSGDEAKQPPLSHQRLASQAADRIRASSRGTIRIRTIADELDVTHEHLSRIFRSSFGISASTYAQNCRIARVALDLSLGLSLSEAAIAAGFADQAHMTRTFQKTYGFSPGTFSKQAKRMVGNPSEGVRS